MDLIIQEFIGDYLPPEEIEFPEEFHDPIEKGFLFSNDLDLIDIYLVNFPFLINNQNNYYGNSTLFIACEYDLKDVAFLLLDYGAKISLKNIFGWTAYDVVKYHGSYNCEMLLEKKAALIIEEAWINYRSNNLELDFENKLIIF